MIVTPENMSFSDKKFSMILYGSPGIGKTTLALSAPDPVLIDFDRSMSRVRSQHRKPAIFCQTYEDVLKDLGSPDMQKFQTVVVDTGGSFITFLQDWAMRDNPAQNRQKNGAISLKGFGAVKQEFIRFTNYVK
nr:AAA family ATPase [Clostridia bacterium]